MERNYKQDFPIFQNNPDLIYLDNAVTVQKPSKVIDGVKNYLENHYSNIHRGAYKISQISEDIYSSSKEKIADFLWVSADEVIYTYNSTYAFNILILSLARSGYFQRWDKVLLSMAEHHANIVPWQILKDEIGIQIEFVNLDQNYDLDLCDFDKKYDSSVKAVSFSYVSNVTWSVFPLNKISERIREDTLFLIDWSQAVPNFQVDINSLGCDFFVFTGHKMMAETGIGILWWRKYLLKKMKVCMWGGGSITNVNRNSFDYAHTPEKFEFGTPNLTGAVSLSKAIDYIQEIWWWKVIEQKERKLTEYALQKFEEFGQYLDIIWKKSLDWRLWVFSFFLKNDFPSPRLGEIMAEKNICIRCWWHCAHPLLEYISSWAVCRMSLYFYNSFEDIDIFFRELNKNFE